ncbi:hypothetical protein CWB41_14620 [Methylovirgula ligni]|uniref:Protease inhibitor Inh n=1 Tax=Methylovirgula ligni TaxID=569860 RepID=A0A3D9Z487_9HYPH|nr:hypothetical protein [Methylovirgula ligni]QAY96816.1 hypothetical protein CWB41_14620 [Methylovirgula ligni]REF88149.1 hypothetical protein DES32_1791 [Methylovirgula ligni]
MRSGKAGLLLRAVLVIAALAFQNSESRAGPFSPLAGDWVGSGTLTMGGVGQRLRCRAIYIVSPRGESLRQFLRCASDSYVIAVDSDVTEIDGRLSGTWRELTSGASGTLTGLVHGPSVAGVVSGLGLSAKLSIYTRGRSQYASINLYGPSIAGVVVTFHRV